MGTVTGIIGFVPTIICERHGKVELTLKEYDKQMGSPNSKWVCPHCGEIAEWDDDCL